METIIDVSLPGGARVDAKVRGFTVSTDQPEADGGGNTAPSPFELFLASLATCAGYFVSFVLSGAVYPFRNLRLVQTVHRNDATHQVEKIEIDILLPPDFPEKYKAAVVRAAESCSVKKVLAAPPPITVSAHQADL